MDTIEIEVADEERDQPYGDGAETERLRAESIQIVRDLIVKANPDLVAEMISGETLTELMDSVAAAKEAYRRVVDTVREQASTVPTPIVPAGGSGTRIAIEDLTSDGLIKQGLTQSRSRWQGARRVYEPQEEAGIGAN